MARLCDRLTVHGSRSITVFDLVSSGRTPEQLLEELTEGVSKDEAESRARFIEALCSYHSADATPARFSALEPAVMIIGDEVGHFANQNSAGNLVEMLAAVIPPFRQTFIDFRGVANGFDLREWGVLFTAVELDEEVHGKTWRHHAAIQSSDAFGTEVPAAARWAMWGSLYGSWDGRTQVGPFGTCQIFLDEHGGILQDKDGEYGVDWLIGGDPRIDEIARILLTDGDPRDHLTSLLVPALLTLSFTHAKNIDVVERLPDPRQSRAFRRRHGRELKHQYVLEITPLRRVLEDDGQLASGGLAQALHICRGHLRTYTSERPMFGKLTGTFWVKAHPRGNPSLGSIEKQYRVATGEPAAPGREWRDDDPEVAPEAHAGGSNPDLSGRGWQAHARTVNALAAHLSAQGLSPLRPSPDGPQFDCAWQHGSAWWVAEVKSITDENEAEQIRRGIGQVVDYRHALADATGDTVHAALVLEREPASRYLEVCADAGITVAWPGGLERLNHWA